MLLSALAGNANRSTASFPTKKKGVKMNIPIPDEVQEIMAELASNVFAAKNPKTGKPIKFEIAKGHSYLYFRHQGNDYCYTPHPDTDGWYYSFAYIGVGSGSRSGQAKRFVMKRLACHRQRKAAKSRALRMFHAVEQCLHPTAVHGGENPNNPVDPSSTVARELGGG